MKSAAPDSGAAQFREETHRLGAQAGRPAKGKRERASVNEMGSDLRRSIRSGVNGSRFGGLFLPSRRRAFPLCHLPREQLPDLRQREEMRVDQGQ